MQSANLHEFDKFIKFKIHQIFRDQSIIGIGILIIKVEQYRVEHNLNLSPLNYTVN